MCRETMELHHDKHHQAYVTALNGFVEKEPSLRGKSLDVIIKTTHNDASKSAVFNNAGQHWNHILFWQAMAPQGGGIPGAMEKKLVEDFGGVDKFKEAFKAAAVGSSAQAGRGWCWAETANWRSLRRPTGPIRWPPEKDGPCWDAMFGSIATTSISVTGGLTTCKTGSTGSLITNSRPQRCDRPERAAIAGRALVACQRWGRPKRRSGDASARAAHGRRPGFPDFGDGWPQEVGPAAKDSSKNSKEIVRRLEVADITRVVESN